MTWFKTCRWTTLTFNWSSSARDFFLAKCSTKQMRDSVSWPKWDRVIFLFVGRSLITMGKAFQIWQSRMEASSAHFYFEWLIRRRFWASLVNLASSYPLVCLNQNQVHDVGRCGKLQVNLYESIANSLIDSMIWQAANDKQESNFW